MEDQGYIMTTLANSSRGQGVPYSRPIPAQSLKIIPSNYKCWMNEWMNAFMNDDCIDLDILGWYFTVLLFGENTIEFLLLHYQLSLKNTSTVTIPLYRKIILYFQNFPPNNWDIRTFNNSQKRQLLHMKHNRFFFVSCNNFTCALSADSFRLCCKPASYIPHLWSRNWSTTFWNLRY